MNIVSLRKSSIGIAGDSYAALSRHLFEVWSGFGVYAILDGASVDSLPEILDESRLSYACLYPGELIEEWARAAPYIVKLQPYNVLTQRVLTQGYGAHWGVFLVSEAGHLGLCEHFRRFLWVLSPEGKKMYFRFYDPRVLSVYLSSCKSTELADFFGPSAAMIMEGSDPAELLEFKLEGGSESTQSKGEIETGLKSLITVRDEQFSMLTTPAQGT